MYTQQGVRWLAGAASSEIKGERKLLLSRSDPQGLQEGVLLHGELLSGKYIFITISQMKHLGPGKGGHAILGAQQGGG